MQHATMPFRALLAVLASLSIAASFAAAAESDAQVGRPVDVASSAYLYRADRKPDANPPESWIALMKAAQWPFDRKVDPQSPEMKKYLTGLLWEEVRPIRHVELRWPADAKRQPRPEDVVVTYFNAEAAGKIPTWWNETVLAEAGKPEVSSDGRTFTFAIPVDTFGLVVSVRNQPDAAAFDIPSVAAFTADTWKAMDIEIEWAFDGAKAAADYSGRIETYDGVAAGLKPLAGDAVTTVKSPDEWTSAGKTDTRRGVQLSLLYQGTSKWRKIWPYNAGSDEIARTIITVQTKSGTFSFLAADLENGPILAPEYGFFVRATRLPPPPPNVPVPTRLLDQKLLERKMDAFLDNPTIRGWCDAVVSPPWFAGNAMGQAVTVQGIFFPARSVAVHPGSDRDVIVAWRSPIDGRVSAQAHLADIQPGGPDGVAWSILQETAVGQRKLAEGHLPSDTMQAIPSGDDVKSLSDVAVRAGDLMMLCVGRAIGNGCDSTGVDLTVTELGGSGRVWNLAKETVDRLVASNPLPDALGNANVWSFLESSPLPLKQPHEPPYDMTSKATSAKEFIAELKAKHLATIRQQIQRHPEQTWQGANAAMFPGKTMPPIPKSEFDTPMKVEVPSAELTAQWNLGAWHLVRHAVKDEQGKLRFNDHPYGILASENYLVFYVLDLLGMHKESADALDQWLTLPIDNKAPVGLFADGNGCFAQAKGPGGFGGDLDGVHGMGPGAIMLALNEHFRLTGDVAWLKANAPRMKANVEWILRQRRILSEILPGGERLWCKGIQPAHQVTPDSGGQLMQFYESDAYYWLGVEQFAQILSQIDPAEGARLASEAAAYRKDLQAAVERSIALSPVTPVRDGTYHSFIPFACYVRGFASGPWSWRRPGSDWHVGGLYWDTIQTAEPLVSPAGVLPIDDPRIQGALDVLEDRLLLENPKIRIRTEGYDVQRQWFDNAGWQYQPGLERQANLHLAGDDAPSFLRSWLNQYATILLPDQGYIFREHCVGGPPDKIFEEAAFLERFRDMLVLEDGDSLWLAKATPRVWLEQGKKISVKNAPTDFGMLAYEIVSDVEHGKIAATIEMPSRNPPKTVLLRLRHPKSSPIKGVTVNGTPWTDFDPAKEVVELHGLTGGNQIDVRY